MTNVLSATYKKIIVNETEMTNNFSVTFFFICSMFESCKKSVVNLISIIKFTRYYNIKILHRL